MNFNNLFIVYLPRKCFHENYVVFAKTRLFAKAVFEHAHVVSTSPL